MKNNYDLLGFLAPQMEPPVPHPDLYGQNICISVTACPPSAFFGNISLSELNQKMLASIESFRKTLEHRNVKIVLCAEDLNVAGLKVILNLQDPPPLSTEVKEYYDLGIRISQIAYQNKNQYGGGFLAPLERLSTEGRTFISALAKNKMILDLAHTGERTALEALIATDELKSPVMISHTGAYGAYQHPRNSADTVIKEVMEQEGIVGVFALTFALDVFDNSPHAYAKHVHYMRSLHPHADKFLVHGSDWWYSPYNRTKAEQTFAMMKAKVDPDNKLGVRFPDQIEAFVGPDRIARTENALASLGFPRTFLKKFFSSNAESFLAKSLPKMI